MENKNELSVLIFSRNDVDELITTINHVKGMSRDVVVIDSSDPAQQKEIEEYVLAKHAQNIKIYHTVALGLAEVLRPYGFSKCRNRWILHLDTDEKISDALRKGIPTMINSGEAAAYAIKRYEDRERGADSPFFTWQIRLYDKKRIRYLGKLHEQPMVKGTIRKLDHPKYYMLHLQRKTGQEYSKLEKFQRLTYLTLKERLLDEASKLFMTKDRRMGTLSRGFIAGTLDLFRGLQSKKETDEIATFEYFLYYLLKNATYDMKQRKFDPARTIGTANYQVSKVEGWQREKDSGIGLKLSTIIENKGIIPYLGFDRVETVNRLTRRYAHSRLKGTDLLIHLLVEKCRRELHRHR
jgi:hypothetical protein